MNEHPLRVMIVVQQPIFRRGVIATLNEMSVCEIGQPTSTREAIEWARTYEPDVALLDTLCGTIDLLDLARQVRASSPQTALMILSDWEGEEGLFQAVKVGASAYAPRTLTPTELLEAMHKVSQGDYLINAEAIVSRPTLASRVLQSFREMAIHRAENLRYQTPSPLSQRETEILSHVARGKRNKEIARVLDISDQTIKNHMTSILRKLQVSDRTAAVVYTVKQHWITLEESRPGAQEKGNEERQEKSQRSDESGKWSFLPRLRESIEHANEEDISL